MAEFNPQTSVTIQNGWIGASDGQIPNRAFGTLFEGAGAIMKRREQAKDEQVQADVQARVDKLDNEIIGSDVPPSLFIKSPNGTAPSQSTGDPLAMKNAGSKLGKLKTAYDQGTLSDGYYMTRVRQISKQLRADYPQYTDKIDDLLSNAIGTSSANSLRKEFNSQFDAETASMGEELKKTHTLISSNLEYVGDIEVTSFYEAKTGKKLDYSNVEGINHNALQEAFGARASDDARRARETAALASLEAGTEATKKLAKSTAVRRATELSDTAVFVAGANGLQELVSKALANDGHISPPEQLLIDKHIAEAEIGMGSKVADLIKQFPEIVDEKDIKDIEGTAFRSFNVVRDALKAGNLSTVQFLTDQVTVKKMTIENGTLANTDHLIAMGRTEQLYGKEVAEAAYTLFNRDKALFNADPKAKAVYAYYASQLMSGASPTKLLTTGIETGDTKTYLPAIESYVTILSNETTTPEQVQKAVETLFSKKEEGLLADLDPTSAEKLFNLMTSPAMLAKLKGSASAKLAYEWAWKQGPVLLKEATDALKGAQKYTDDATVVYDKGRFRVDSANDTTKAGMYPFENQRLNAGREAARKMNSFIEKMEPLLASNDDTVDTFLTKVFGSEDYTSLHKEGSFFTRMGVAFREMNKSMNENMKKADEKPTVKGAPMIRGMSEKKNIGKEIDTTRPILENSDGSFSTEETITLTKDGKWYNVPTIVNGKRIPEGQIEDLFNAGKVPNVGEFKTLEEAEDAARKRSEEIGKVRGPDRRSDILDDKFFNLTSFIKGAEGADYNTMFGGSQAELTSMTAAEVLKKGIAHAKKNKKSSASGAYQVITSTLQGLIDKGVIDDEELFTEEVQDRIALALMNEKGYQKFKNGKLSKEKFADRLAEIWASLPNAKGESHYKGVGGNRATVKREDFIEVLKQFEA